MYLDVVDAARGGRRAWSGHPIVDEGQETWAGVAVAQAEGGTRSWPEDDGLTGCLVVHDEEPGRAKLCPAAVDHLLEVLHRSLENFLFDLLPKLFADGLPHLSPEMAPVKQAGGDHNIS